MRYPSNLKLQNPYGESGPRQAFNRALYDGVCGLITGIKSFLAQYEGSHVEGSHVSTALRRLNDQELGTSLFTEPQPQALSVGSVLSTCLSDFEKLSGDLPRLISTVAPSFRWYITEGFSDDALGDGFTSNYAATQLIGPNGFFPGADFQLGFFWVGPNRFFPEHYQPAPELCCTLTAESFWSCGGGKPFLLRERGTIVWLPSMTVHAIITTASPLLVLSLRIQDTASPTKLKWM